MAYYRRRDKYRYIGEDGGREIIHQGADGYIEGCGWKNAFGF